MNRVVRVAGMQAMHGPDNIGFTHQGESGFIVSDLLEKERKNCGVTMAPCFVTSYLGSK